MASSSKKKTTMAKLNREAAVRDKRLQKAARKTARKLAAENPVSSEPSDDETLAGEEDDRDASLAGAAERPAGL